MLKADHMFVALYFAFNALDCHLYEKS